MLISYSPHTYKHHSVVLSSSVEVSFCVVENFNIGRFQFKVDTARTSTVFEISNYTQLVTALVAK